MALRFQDDDEVDQKLKDDRGNVWLLIVLSICFAALYGFFYWLLGESVNHYREKIAWLVGTAIVFWYASPLYFEFRYRTKEINGKVSSLELSVKMLTEQLNEISEKLERIDRRR